MLNNNTSAHTVTYYTHDNGSLPFKVNVTNNMISVYKQTYDMENDCNVLDNEPCLELQCQKIFIGKSPLNEMTEFSGGHGSNFDGNSILVCVADNEYIYIGECIYKFTSKAEIIEYVSPVGNNDVPYPYAIDVNGSYYMICGRDIIYNIPNISLYGGDPYRYYYKAINMIDYSYNLNGKYFEDIAQYLIGDEVYGLSYHSVPARDYDRIQKWDDFGNGMVLKFSDGTQQNINRDDYIRLNEKYGSLMGFEAMNIHMLQERR
jgi:hypothetical protein